jgi:gamma-glutamylcyclotransferase (GGCT)/AIG2-like uncharacterized protein YtfP
MKKNVKRFFKRVINETLFTPDMPELNIWKSHNLFVYGTLKQGEKRHSLLDDKWYVGPATTTLDNYCLREYRKGGFPILKYEPEYEHRGHIEGELYSVPARVIRHLDQIEQNGELFKRRRIKLKDPSGKQHYAWCYYGNPLYWVSDDLAFVPYTRSLVSPFPCTYDWRQLTKKEMRAHEQMHTM